MTTSPTFTEGPDTYTVTAPGDYVLDFLGGDDTLTVNGGTTTTATMDDGDDYVRLLKGAANVDGGAGDDRFDITTSGITASGGIGDDLFILRGGSNQTINGDDGNDRINFSGNVTNLTADLGAGADLYNGYGHTVSGNLSGGDGNDTFLDLMGTGVSLNEMGGLGNDTYRVDSTSMGGTIVEYAGEGTDTVQLLRGFNYVLPTNVENIIVGSYAGSHGNAATITLNASDNGFTGSGNAETVFGMDGNDHLYGKAGDDVLHGGNGNDTLDGGLGNDTLYGDAGNDVLNGRDGDDTMVGGIGNDTYYVDSTSDVVVENAGEGVDNVRTTVNWTLGDNIENGVIASADGLALYGNDLDNHLYGNAGVDTIDGGNGNDYVRGEGGDDFVYGGAGNDSVIGDAGSDSLFGQDGNDHLYGGADDDFLYGGDGNDILEGNAGNDFLTGGVGQDTLIGGADSDTFAYFAANESTSGAMDQITDFQSNAGATAGDDVLDLSQIDANTGTAGDQAFTWNGTNAAANSVWISSDTANGDGSHDIILSGDTSGDTTADFQIAIHLTTGALHTDDIVF